MPAIHIACAVIMDDQNHILLVRKKGTAFFMQPGGKIDPGETPLTALKRELNEEIARDYADQDITYLGQESCLAANEPDTQLLADIYLIRDGFEAQPAAEIEDVAWLHYASFGQRNDLAPLTGHIIPRLLKTRFNLK